MARRKKNTEEQMQLFEEGGLKDEGGTVDPVSGNDVPAGSTQAEVRDDIPAQLSEGEFVFPADVVRYIGLENLMELRSKAKQGLAKMEAMGQMGNSEEATMDDDGEYDGEIDELIDNFDPNNPETLAFATGGVVKAYNGQFIPASGVPAPEYYQTYGASNPSAYRVPMIPSAGVSSAMGQTQPSTYQSFIGAPAQAAAIRAQQAGTVENREYIGPNGERTTIRFMNGRPIDTIPQGYTEFDPATSQIQPQITTPQVTDESGGGDSQGEREREAEREAQMAKDKEISNTLAAYNKDFAEQWSEDPFNTGKMGIGGPMAAAWDSIQTHMARTPAIEAIAEEYGIDLENYTNKGIKGFFSKYDDERFAKDLKEKYESLAEKTQREANEKARAPEIAALRAKEAERISNLTAEQEAAREAQREANLQATQERAAAIRESDGGGGGDAGGPTGGQAGRDAGGYGDFSGRDADGWGE